MGSVRRLWRTCYTSSAGAARVASWVRVLVWRYPPPLLTNYHTRARPLSLCSLLFIPATHACPRRGHERTRAAAAAVQPANPAAQRPRSSSSVPSGKIAERRRLARVRSISQSRSTSLGMPSVPLASGDFALHSSLGSRSCRWRICEPGPERDAGGTADRSTGNRQETMATLGVGDSGNFLVLSPPYFETEGQAGAAAEAAGEAQRGELHGLRHWRSSFWQG